MGKHADAVKPFDQFRAPWETEGGSDAEIDKPKLKRWIHGVLTDKAKAQDSRDDVTAEMSIVQKTLEETKAEVEKASPDESNKKIVRLEAENTKLKDEAKAAKDAKEASDLRAEVIGDLDPKYAKYVVGTDRESLEKSLEAVKADFGVEGKEGDEDLDEYGDPVVRTTPRTRISNPADPDGKKGGSDAIDFDKVADGIVGNGIFR